MKIDILIIISLASTFHFYLSLKFQFFHIHFFSYIVPCTKYDHKIHDIVECSIEICGHIWYIETFFSPSHAGLRDLFLPPGWHFMGRPATCLTCASHSPPHQCTYAHGRGQLPFASSSGHSSTLHASAMGAGPKKYFGTMFHRQIKHS